MQISRHISQPLIEMVKFIFTRKKPFHACVDSRILNIHLALQCPSIQRTHHNIHALQLGRQLVPLDIRGIEFFTLFHFQIRRPSKLWTLGETKAINLNDCWGQCRRVHRIRLPIWLSAPYRAMVLKGVIATDTLFPLEESRNNLTEISSIKP